MILIYVLNVENLKNIKMKKAYYRKIPCYFDSDTNEILGRNIFYDILIDINIWIDFTLLGIEELPIWIEED